MKDNTPGQSGFSHSVSKQLIFSSLWLDECELQVGMRFRDKYELEKAVELYSNRRQRDYTAFLSKFVCKKYRGWALIVAKTEAMALR